MTYPHYHHLHHTLPFCPPPLRSISIIATHHSHHTCPSPPPPPQYYQLMRLGRSGFKRIMGNLMNVREYLANRLLATGFFVQRHQVIDWGGLRGGIVIVA